MEDTGNLVLRNAANATVWQSFDSPSDTLLPGQMFNSSSLAVMKAWQNDDDWRGGNYMLQWKSNDMLIIRYEIPYSWEASSRDYWTATQPFSTVFLTSSGEFQGIDMNGNTVTIATADEQGEFFRLTITKDGNLCMYSSSGTVVWSSFVNKCEIFNICGPYAMCIGGECSCPEGFQLVDPDDTRLGCRRIEAAAFCKPGVADTFGPPLAINWWGNDLPGMPLSNVNVSFCMDQCLASCYCQDFIMIRDDCYLKKDALLNGLYAGSGLSYVRVAGTFRATPPPASKAPADSEKNILVPALAAAVATLAVLSCISWSLLATRQMHRMRLQRLQSKWNSAKGAMIRFSYREIVLMTENFGTKIGEGGHGTVFKGHIGSFEVAVKRLNPMLSSQVEKEFANEVDCIGLIHHVHLVSLLGYCAEDNHRLLVYEYVKRGSLDRALFGVKSPVLEWRDRYAIAIQVARGLAYLHDDCDQRIVHCDVKPENILLDENRAVKVADFGISRILKRDQTQTQTMHIRGTRGYLGPEWVTTDRLSITNKVDVYSFGMVLLEIVSGRRNLMPDHDDMDAYYFPTWAFPRMGTDAFLDVVDPALTGIVDPVEVKRALQVAFWCINSHPQARPTMSEVVQMLQGHIAIAVPVPKPIIFDESSDPSLHGLSSSFSAESLSDSLALCSMERS